MKQLVTKRVIILMLVMLFMLCVVMFGFRSSASAATSTNHQFLADVNGDGKADAAVFYPATGQWRVAISNGSSFNTPVTWMYGHGVGSSKQFLADVNGDGKADAVVYFAQTGDWWVAVSDGVQFGPQGAVQFIHGHGVGSRNQLMGDINGDGKADALAFFDNGPTWYSGTGWSSGAWWVATSNLAGNRFDQPGLWFSGGHGVGSDNQILADVDGDGKADAVVFFNRTGEWWVSNSDGVHFATGPNRWAVGKGVGSAHQFLKDVNGDNRADMVLFFDTTPYPSKANWWVAPAGGPGSNTFAIQMPWMTGHGVGSTNQLVGDASGDGKADAIVFFGQTGDWYVANSSGTDFNNSDQYYYPPRWISNFGIGY